MDRNKLDRANEINRKLKDMERKAEWLRKGCSVHFADGEQPRVLYDDDESYMRVFGDTIWDREKEIFELAQNLYAKLREKVDREIKELEKELDEL